MIVMAVIYFLTLISVAVIGIPLTFATSTIKSCDIITDESTKELCFSPLFLGSDLKRTEIFPSLKNGFNFLHTYEFVRNAT